MYRRREMVVSVEKNGTKLDNRYVVPYNRYLLVKYESHVNVEACNKSKAIKYLFKYVTKGPDTLTAEIQESGSKETSNTCPQISIMMMRLRHFLIVNTFQHVQQFGAFINMISTTDVRLLTVFVTIFKMNNS